MVAELGVGQVFGKIEEIIGKKLSKKMKTKLRKHIRAVFAEKVSPKLKELMLNEYDSLTQQEKSQYGTAIRGKDPSALENFRHLFEKQITEELRDMRFEGDTLLIQIGDQDKWGLGRQEPPTGVPVTVDFLGYYIEGVAGEFGFVSLEQYEEMRNRTPTKLGRFGKGFLIPRERYEKERWEEFTQLSFEDIRHPISGQSPFTGFDEAVGKFDFSPYITEAVENAFREIGRELL